MIYDSLLASLCTKYWGYIYFLTC
uniref:Uncharacterized protein n=1 Tax=Anguilla anguilla TaxID=7936 RepID=A0A0E9W2X6_ANGAN